MFYLSQHFDAQRTGQFVRGKAGALIATFVGASFARDSFPKIASEARSYERTSRQVVERAMSIRRIDVLVGASLYIL